MQVQEPKPPECPTAPTKQEEHKFICSKDNDQSCPYGRGHKGNALKQRAIPHEARRWQTPSTSRDQRPERQADSKAPKAGKPETLQDPKIEA